MIERIKAYGLRFYYSFPIQLLINHFKRNHVLLACWILLFAMVTGHIGEYLGIPYLFLDPVYLNDVSFLSFAIMGITIAGFTIAFHIASYIDDGHRFSFVGTLPKPFTIFSINNSIIPLVFLVVYVSYIIDYQIDNEFSSHDLLLIKILGLLSGYVAMTLVLFGYLWLTNKDIFKFVVCKLDEKLKQNLKVTRANAMQKLDIARKKQVRVDSFLNLKVAPEKVEKYKGFYDKEVILQVFDQNHFNLVIIQFIIFLVVICMGIFKDYSFFQLPAAASAVLFLTIFLMFAGAFSYWFGNWSLTAGLALLIILNTAVQQDFFHKTYKAFGLNYDKTLAEYTNSSIKIGTNQILQAKDKAATIKILENWKNKFDSTDKPKMVFICVSGGGQRAALWALNAMQKVDQATQGNFMKQAMLITGASGGLIGASYYREMVLRNNQGSINDLYSEDYIERMGSDNLNAIIFSLLMNDLFAEFQDFEYSNILYPKDRGYSFENQLNNNTNHFLDKPLSAYRKPEFESQIPMMILAPTIINDGRKLFISPQNISYMMNSMDSAYNNDKINGVEFLRMFDTQGAKNLRFLSGLRMSAAFPYITPNVTLPSTPPIDIMDAGVTDNFGISDAIQFVYAFKEWIAYHTGGIVIVSIRDSEKDGPIIRKKNLSLIDKTTMPISSIYQNFENLQDITNDNKIDFARSWFKGSIERIDIQYNPEKIDKTIEVHDSIVAKDNRRASLSWRLTSKEKKSITQNINSKSNQEAIQDLKKILSSN